MNNCAVVPTLTAQEAFDRVARHLLSMSRQSRGAGGCVYRAPDGGRCAIGCLIPEGLYSSGLESRNVASLVEGDAAFKPWRPILRLLRILQTLHDCDTCWSAPDGRATRREWLADIARDFDLSPHVLDEMECAP